jgi:hypothetical protein
MGSMKQVALGAARNGHRLSLMQIIYAPVDNLLPNVCLVSPEHH